MYNCLITQSQDVTVKCIDSLHVKNLCTTAVFNSFTQ